MTATTTTAPVPTPSRTDGLGAASRLIGGRVLKHFFRSRVMVIVTIGFPVVQLFMQLAAFQLLVRDTVGEPYVARLAPLIVLITASAAILTSAIGFWADIRSGVFTRFRTMPINALSVLYGRILGDLARIMIVAVVVVLVALTVGFRFEQGILAVLGFFAVVALFGIMCTAISVLVALSAPHPGAIVAWVQLPSLTLGLMSSGYVPLQVFPQAVQPFVAVNPVSLAAETLIGLSYGGPVLVPALGTLAWTVGVTVVCSVFMVRKFRNFTAA